MPGGKFTSNVFSAKQLSVGSGLASTTCGGAPGARDTWPVMREMLRSEASGALPLPPARMWHPRELPLTVLQDWNRT